MDLRPAARQPEQEPSGRNQRPEEGHLNNIPPPSPPAAATVDAGPGAAPRKQRFPRHPKHPERICWGCDKYCPADNLICGNGSGRTEHPCETLGEDWYLQGGWAEEFGADAPVDPSAKAPRAR